MLTVATTYGYTKGAIKQRRKLLQARADYHHLMMASVVKLAKPAVMMATKCRV